MAKHVLRTGVPAGHIDLKLKMTKFSSEMGILHQAMSAPIVQGGSLEARANGLSDSRG